VKAAAFEDMKKAMPALARLASIRHYSSRMKELFFASFPFSWKFSMSTITSLVNQAV